MGMQDAINAGADAFFDEKYGETVRTIRVQDYSFELCGGTHCRASGQIGSFVITSDRSIGSGMRRIEALTGAVADTHFRTRSELLEGLLPALAAQTVEQVPSRVAALQDELRDTKRRLKAGAGGGVPKAGDIAARAVEVAPGVRLASLAADLESMDALKRLAKDVSAALGSGIVALALEADEPQVFVTVSDDLVKRGLAAGELVRAAMPPIEGKGGGRPEMAQGKGTSREGLAGALAALETAAREAAGRGG
jgi:alanyl-tRNA synthetase